MNRQDGVALARAWHGDVGQIVNTIHIRDQDFPDLIVCGELVSLTVMHDNLPIRIGLDSGDAWLGFDPASTHGRLYASIPAQEQREMLQLITGDEWMPLVELAGNVGGRQNKDGYADAIVLPIGPIVQVEYAAKKYLEFEADDGAVFHHEFEATHPWLAMDERGRLFFAGGAYIGDDNRGIVG